MMRKHDLLICIAITCMSLPAMASSKFDDYKLPPVPSVFDDCAFGSLFSSTDSIAGILNMVDRIKSDGLCGFSLKDIKAIAHGDTDPLKRLNHYGDVYEDSVKKSIGDIKFPYDGKDGGNN